MTGTRHPSRTAGGLTLRVAAAGDLHLGEDSPRRYRRSFERAARQAELLVLAGDLTKVGTPDQARLVAADVTGLGVPVLGVLGNHDCQSDQVEEVTAILTDAGMTVLEGTGVVLDIRGIRLGVAGIKGFGGGFGNGLVPVFGEPEMKAFAASGRSAADRLAATLSELDCDLKLAVTHYAPVPGTLAGERRELYPLLGCEYLGRAIDTGGAAMAIHGHPHHGTEHGQTPGGVPVRNVAYPVIKTAYRIYPLASPVPVEVGARADPTPRNGRGQ